MSAVEYAQLIEYLGRQFAAIDRRFDAIDYRFDAIDHRFDAVDRRFDAIDGRFVVADGRFVAIEGRVGAIEGQLAEFRREMLGHFDEIYRRLERLEQEYVAITQALRRIEARLDDEAGRREILERDVAELKRQTAHLQSRIEAIEQRLNA